MNILIKDIDIDILSKGVFCANLVTKNGKSYILIKAPNENGYAQNKYFPFNEISTPHGRLIDADEIEKCVHEWYDVGEYVFADTIRNADTIIEAEASE